jgi:hypothetical protein
MSRKDFEAIAKIIKQERTLMIKEAGHSVPVVAVAVGLAAYFAEVNPRFDREKFLNATTPDQ